MKEWLVKLADGSKLVINDNEYMDLLKKFNYKPSIKFGIKYGTCDPIFIDGVEVVSMVREDCDRYIPESQIRKRMVS